MPYTTTDAPETGKPPQPTRSVVIFRLKSIDAPIPSGAPETPELGKKTVDTVLVEVSNSERFYVDPSRKPYEAERREAKLVTQFCEHLKESGLDPKRLRIKPIGELKPLFCDIYVESVGLIVEAKGTVDRNSVRMALGQLLDYSRFVSARRRALLLPSRPRPDLIALISSAGAELYYPNSKKSGFDHVVPDKAIGLN